MSHTLDGVRVLIVEDEYLIASELQATLVDVGCTVVGPVAKLKDALALAQNAELDAAVLDVRLGRDDSAPVAEALSARECPFLFATGYGAADVPQAAWGAPVLIKPVAPTELLAALRHLLRR